MPKKTSSKSIYKKNCLFCKMAQHKHPAPIIFENEYVFAFVDESPAGEQVGHTLVIPKKHFPTIDKIEEKYLTEVELTIKNLVPAIKKVSGADGMNILQNNGKSAGQCVMHAHFHLIPRKMGDGIWFETKRRNAKPFEQTGVAKAIQKALQKR